MAPFSHGIALSPDEIPPRAMPAMPPYKSPSYLRLHWLGPALLSAAHALLAGGYGDGAAARLWCGIGIGCLAMAAVVPRVRRPVGVRASLMCLTAAYWMTHFALPLGAATGIVFVVTALTVYAIELRLRVVGLWLLFAGGVPVVAVAIGADALPPRGVPPAAAALLTLAIGTAASTWQLGASRRRMARSLTRLKTLRQQMLRERDALAERERLLTEAGEANRAEIDALTAQLMSEAAVTDDLRLRQDDRRSVVHAIHHDLSEPLRAIVSFTQLARRRLGQYEGAEALGDYLAFAEDGGRRMSTMLADLLEYSRDPEGEPASECSLDEVLAEVLLNVHDAVERRGARVTVDELYVVSGHRTQLVQLFQNLLSNALKFARPGVSPTIAITVHEREDGPEIRVADNGIGIPANQLDKVFGLFNRAHAEDNFEGSGVGLALCRKIVIAHGGRISLASVPGEGTTFSLSLPRVGAAEALSAAGALLPATATATPALVTADV